MIIMKKEKSRSELGAELWELLSKGFFKDVDLSNYMEDDLINFEWLLDVYERMGGEKYKTKYFIKHHRLGTPWERPGNSDEEIYKDCLAMGITWDEYFNR